MATAKIDQSVTGAPSNRGQRLARTHTRGSKF
jgi:hypothetical protein